ncbi:MAG: aspartate-semialdehyde dehydrogenase [Alphaproteobacteria bacterium]|nr:aspartate-semialdehyde dehydrogenase [Alphaproteobacteria bacterium]
MRTTILAALAFAAATGLAACDRSVPPTEAPAQTPAAPADAATPAQSDGGLAIEGEGLRIFDAMGAARALPFETPQATVIAAVTASIGGMAPEETSNAECGQGATQFATYSNGLQLLFQDGKFNGWFLDQAGLTTVDGVGVGTTRAALAEARTVEMVPDSTLGAEFSAGDIGGFLTSTAADATVESLYAGGNCFFR